MRRAARILWLTSRPLSWVNTAYPFAAGYLMMGGQADARLLVGTLFFLIPYNLLMYGVNDVFDYESDIRNPRKGGVEGAVTARVYHPLILWASMLSCAPFVIALIVMGVWVSSLVLVGLLFFVIAYSAKGLRFKEVPFLDSVTSSIHFAGPLVYAYTLVGATPEGWIAAAAFFLWGVASQAFGAVQDIVPDRQAKLASIATVLGASRTVRFALGMYMGATVLLASLGGLAAIVAATGLMYVANIWPYHRLTDTESHEARAGWRRFLWINFIMGAVVTICCLLSRQVWVA